MSPRGPDPYAGCTTCTNPLAECIHCGAGWCMDCDDKHACPEGETAALCALQRAYTELQELHGWQSATYAPRDVELEVIEIGSVGIFRAYREDDGFTVCDGVGDAFHSHPILFRVRQ